MTEWITSVIDNLGYAGLAFLSFLETLVPPIPSEVVGPLAGMTVSQGGMTFVGALLASMTGFLAGVMPLYAIGRFVTEDRLRGWADRHGRWLGLSGDDIDRACAWFNRHGSKVVIISHLAPGIRSLISVPAGLAGMNVFKFLLFTAIGKGLWTMLMIYLGTVLGDNYEAIGRFLGPISYVIIGAVVASIIFFIVRRRQQAAEA
jgi:membrane protein DedA with SNARE-associated domain